MAAEGRYEPDDIGVEVCIMGGSKGKGLIAKRKFYAGETIFEEKPLVSCQFSWNQAYGYLACDFCMRPLETAEENARRLTGNYQLVFPYPEPFTPCCWTRKERHVDCPNCDVSYCSEQCRKSAFEQYHQTLCLGNCNGDPNHPLAQLQNAWRTIHYPPETANIMLIARMIATVIQATDKEGALHLFSQFCHRTINEEENLIHKLFSAPHRDQLEHLRQLLANALYCDYLDHWFSPDGFRSLVALVGTNGQGIGTSPLSIWVRNCDALNLSDEDRMKLNAFIKNVYEEIERVTGAFVNNEGSGLYPLQSACNHSCIPNAEAAFLYSDFTLVMEATHDIEPNEEILVCYLDEFNRNRSRRYRIKLLQENYLFTCTCPRCEAERVHPTDATSDDESIAQ